MNAKQLLTLMTSLTKGERKVLEHRLDVPDALCDVLQENFPNLSHDTTYDVCEHITNDRYEKACAVDESLVDALLIDAVEGGTWCGNVRNMSPQARMAAGLSRRLAAKVSRAVHCQVNYPEW